MKLFDSFINSVLHKRWLYIVIIAAITVISSFYTVKNLSVDNSLSIWFLDDNPDYKEYINFQETQGSDEIIIALIPVDDGLSKKNINTLHALHKSIDSLSFVNATFSLANAKYPNYFNKKITYRSIFNPNRAKKGTESLLNKMPIIKEQLITNNSKNLLFYTQLKPTTEIEKIRAKAVETITTIINKKTNNKVAISGAPILNEAYNKTVYDETIFFAVLTILVILIMLLFLLSKPLYIIAALLSVIIPISFLFGFISILGYKLNLILMLIPTVLMVYCLSDAVHIITIFNKYIEKHPKETKEKQIYNALKKSLKPCFYTTITTLIGYFALYLSPLPAFKSMGIFASIGLLVSFVLVYIIIAITFSFKNPKSVFKNTLFTFFKEINLQPILYKLNSITTRFKKQILVFVILIFITGIYAITKIEVNTDALNLLGNGKVKSDLHTIENTLHGSTRLQLNIVSKNKESLLTNTIFNQLEAFQNKLSDNELVSSPVSLLNVKSFLQKRAPFLSASTKISKNISDQFLKTKEESNSFFSLFSDDFSSLGISINIKELKTKELEYLLETIKKDFNTSFNTSDYKLNIQGFSYIYAKLNTFILQTQFRSFSMAFLVSFLVLFFFIKNLKITLIALVPNLLPLAILAIVMVVFKIPLDVSSAMIAPIMLGISMDDTIHFIYNYKKNNSTKNSLQSTNETILYTGKALISTTLILTFGFLVLCFSGVKSVSNFGFLCAITIGAALISDLIFLPVLLKLFRKN